MVKVILFVFISQSAFAGNKIVVKDQELLGGGSEILLTGDPVVISERKGATIYSGKTQMIVFDDKSRRVKHTDGVRIELKNGAVLESETAQELKGGGSFAFRGVVILSDLNKAGGTTTFSCSGGIVHKDGESTGESTYTHRNVLDISCSSDDVLTVKPHVMEP